MYRILLLFIFIFWAVYIFPYVIYYIYIFSLVTIEQGQSGLCSFWVVLAPLDGFYLGDVLGEGSSSSSDVWSFNSGVAVRSGGVWYGKGSILTGGWSQGKMVDVSRWNKMKVVLMVAVTFQMVTGWWSPPWRLVWYRMTTGKGKGSEDDGYGSTGVMMVMIAVTFQMVTGWWSPPWDVVQDVYRQRKGLWRWWLWFNWCHDGTDSRCGVWAKPLLGGWRGPSEECCRARMVWNWMVCVVLCWRSLLFGEEDDVMVAMVKKMWWCPGPFSKFHLGGDVEKTWLVVVPIPGGPPGWGQWLP